MNTYALVETVARNDCAKLMKIKEINLESLKAAAYSLPLRVGELSSSTVYNVNRPDSSGLTLMHIAAYFDSLDIFVCLNSMGLSIHILSASNVLPLHYACMGGSVEVAAYILEKLEEEPLPKPIINNFLYLATMSGCPMMISMLFDYGFKQPDGQLEQQELITCAVKQTNYECLKLLLENKAGIIDNERERSLLQIAINFRHVEAVPLLLDAGVDPYFIAPDNSTALSYACMLGLVDVVRMLCDRMTNVDLPAKINAQAAVHWLCNSKSIEIAKIILAKGIDVNRFDQNGNLGPYILIGIAKSELVVEFLELLHEHGLNIDKRASAKTNTLLGQAVISWAPDFNVIDWLLRHGADVNATLMPLNITISSFIRETIKDPRSCDADKLAVFKRIASKWLPEAVE